MRAAVTAATPYGIPVTAKFRMGIDDSLITFLETGRIAEDEGLAAVALHARTAEQHYSGEARWEAIARLKQAVVSIPVLGNGDIWTADDALRMMAATGCDGVVIGRGCLGRPWLFGDLVAALSGSPAPSARTLGEVTAVMTDHVRLLSSHFGTDSTGVDRGVRDFRKHTSWYLTGYPVGGEIRARLAMAATVADVDALVAELIEVHGPDLTVVDGGERIRRGKTNGPIRVALPDGFLENLDDMCVPDDNDVMALSGG
jgi:nifR3 family TIM-barrel protein